MLFTAGRGRQTNRVLPAEGGAFVERSSGAVTAINPLLAETQAERDLAALVFAGMTRMGPDGSAVPDLADEWEASADALTFTFRLRRGLEWHDGEPLTVDDVLYTIGVIQAGGGVDAGLAEVWREARVTRFDERRLRVELPTPFAALPVWATFGVLPRHLLGEASIAELRTAPFNQRPVGAGPFRLLALEAERAQLSRFDQYHFGAPYLDRIELRFGGTGGADGDAGMTGGVLAPAGQRAHTLGRNAYGAVMLNNDNALFASDTVRRALSLAIDRRALAARTLGGRGQPTDVPFAIGSWAHDGFEPFASDRQLAGALLASAGWQPGGDGVLRRGDRELRFTLVTADEPAWVAVARALAEEWAALGVRVTVAPAGRAALMSEFLNPRAYEAALIGWDPGPDPDPFTAWHSSLRGKPGGNFANFADQRSDQLLVESRVLADPAERRERYIQFAGRFRELAPSIVLYTETLHYGLREEITPSLPGVVRAPEDRFTDVHRWYMRTRVVH